MKIVMQLHDWMNMEKLFTEINQHKKKQQDGKNVNTIATDGEKNANYVSVCKTTNTEQCIALLYVFQMRSQSIIYSC